MNETKLKPCPFCGGTKLKIDKKSKLVNYRHVAIFTVSVRCSCCHARGGTVSGEVGSGIADPISDKLTTYKELQAKAAESWNSRHEDVDTTVHGKWIDIEPEYNYEKHQTAHYQCSVCEHYLVKSGLDATSVVLASRIEDSTLSCPQYKSTTSCIDVPCNIGDTVYYVPDGRQGIIIKYVVTAIHISDEGTIRHKLHKSHIIAFHEQNKLSNKFNFDEFGSRLFTTYEAAINVVLCTKECDIDE